MYHPTQTKKNRKVCAKRVKKSAQTDHCLGGIGNVDINTRIIR